MLVKMEDYNQSPPAPENVLCHLMEAHHFDVQFLHFNDHTIGTSINGTSVTLNPTSTPDRSGAGDDQHEALPLADVKGKQKTLPQLQTPS